MHLHPPTERIDSIKQFLIHLVMIVLGILIALGLEQWRESLHHKAVAEQAIAEITQEIERNLALTRKYLPAYEITLKEFESGIATQKAAITAFVSKSGPVPEPKNEGSDIGRLGLQSTAWNMANTNQALSYMPRDTALKLSKIYNSQKIIMELDLSATPLFSGVAALGDFPLNASLPEMKEQLRAMNQALSVYKSRVGNYKALDKAYAEFLGKPVADSPALKAS